MNLASLSAALENHGWEEFLSKTRQNESWLRYASENQIFVETRFTIKKIGNIFSLRTLNNYCNDEFHQTSFKIHNISDGTGDLSSFIIRDSWRMKVTSDLDENTVAHEITDRTSNFLNSFSYQDFKKTSAKNRPDTGIWFQQNHITALAILGNYQTLMDYQDSFKSGNRLNFLEPITTEMIDRALEIALQNSNL